MHSEEPEMVRQVARGLARLRVEQNMRWPDFCKEPMTEKRMEAAVEHGWPEFVAEARAAIAAMREPTTAMGWAGLNARETSADPDLLAGNPGRWMKPTWRAMIDAALGQETTDHG